jgi:hypothetical protein
MTLRSGEADSTIFILKKEKKVIFNRHNLGTITRVPLSWEGYVM